MVDSLRRYDGILHNDLSLHGDTILFTNSGYSVGPVLNFLSISIGCTLSSRSVT